MPLGDSIPEHLERIATEIVDAAFCVHKEMKAGLLESVYVTCLAYELTKRGFKVQREVELPVFYQGVRMEVGFRIDLLIEDQILIEVKSVERMEPIFKAVLHNYLRLSQKRLGFLINFNTLKFTDGIQRIVI